jgi:hypothetical protein
MLFMNIRDQLVLRARGTGDQDGASCLQRVRHTLQKAIVDADMAAVARVRLIVQVLGPLPLRMKQLLPSSELK